MSAGNAPPLTSLPLASAPPIPKTKQTAAVRRAVAQRKAGIVPGQGGVVTKPARPGALTSLPIAPPNAAARRAVRQSEAGIIPGQGGVGVISRKKPGGGGWSDFAGAVGDAVTGLPNEVNTGRRLFRSAVQHPDIIGHFVKEHFDSPSHASRSILNVVPSMGSLYDAAYSGKLTNVDKAIVGKSLYNTSYNKGPTGVLHDPKALLELGILVTPFRSALGAKVGYEAFRAGEGIPAALRAAREARRTSAPMFSALGAGKRQIFNRQESKVFNDSLLASPARKQLHEVIDQMESPRAAAVQKAKYDKIATQLARQQGMTPGEYFGALNTVLHETQHLDPAMFHGGEFLAQRGNLEGLPTEAKMGDQTIQVGHSPDLRTVANDYMENLGRTHNAPTAYEARDAEVGANVAHQYDQMKDMNAPGVSPEYRAAVEHSYAKFTKETLDQYHWLVANGYHFEFYPKGGDPYPLGPRQAIEDLKQNKHLYVFPTEGAFGSGAEKRLGPMKDGREVIEGVQVDYAYHPETNYIVIHDFTALHQGVGSGQNALRALRSRFPNATIRAWDTGGSQGFWDKMKQRGLIDETTDAEGNVAAVSNHPLLSDSGIYWGDRPTTVNDIFRGVHDVFGHGKEGVGFRADGEYNAFLQHAAMYSPEARMAMEAETNGQNSWVNFGPHAEANRGADQASTVYAEQKAGIMGYDHNPQARLFEPDAAVEKIKPVSSVTLKTLQKEHQGDLPRTINTRGIAQETINSGLLLPKELRNTAALNSRVRFIYEHLKAGTDGRFWYRDAANVSREISKKYPQFTPEQVAQVIAIFSQAADTVVNMGFVRKALDQFVDHGSTYAGRYPERQHIEANAVLRGGTWEGRKRSSFYSNIVQELNPEEYARLQAQRVAEGIVSPGDHPVTVDRWVTRWFTPSKDTPGEYYDAYEHVIQRIADQLGWSPKEAQAAAWVATKKLSLASRRPNASQAEINRSGADHYNVGLERNFGDRLFREKTLHPNAERAVNLVRKPGGGGTFRHTLQQDVAKTGYYAAHGAYEQKVFPAKAFTAKMLEDYRDAHLDLLKKNPAFRVGLWHNPDNSRIYIDISRRFSTKQAMLDFAHKEGQLAGFDAKGKLVLDKIKESNRTEADWESAFPSTGHTSGTADKIKLALQGELHAKGELPPLIGKAGRLFVPKSVERKAAAISATQKWENALKVVAKSQGYMSKTGAFTIQARKDAESYLHEYITKHPDSEVSKLYDRVTTEVHGSEPHDVFQREKPVSEGGLGPIRGAYVPATRTIHISRSGDSVTLEHEFLHDVLHQIKGTPEEATFAEWAGATKQDDGTYHWGRDAQEKFVEGSLQDGPLRDALRAVNPSIAEGFNRIFGEGDNTPAAQLREGLKGNRTQYGKEKVKQSEELSKRSKAVAEAFRSHEDPDEAMRAARAAMRGTLPTIDHQGLKTLDEHSLLVLKKYAKDFEGLMPFQRANLIESLDKAYSGRLLTPSQMLIIEHVFGKTTAMGIKGAAEKKWGDTVIQILNIPRSLMATADISALFRQSLVAFASHPLLWKSNIPMMLKAMRSGDFYEKAMQEIKDDPFYSLAIGHVSFTDVGEHTSALAHEEQFGSDLVARVPVLGSVLKGSSRAYTGFLNKLRMDLFKQQMRIALVAGRNIQDEKFLRQIGDVVNAATGRGTIHGRAEHILPALNTIMFSPRLMLSRLNYLDPTWYYRLKGQARKEALRGLFATVGAVTTAVYLASLIPGVDIGSIDPRSSDFGKLRIGDIHVDLAGGFSQYIHLAGELITNQKVSATTKSTTNLGSGFGVPNRLDEILKFSENKLAPFGGIVANTLRGKTTVGDPVTVQGTLYNSLAPLVAQDAISIYKERKGGLDGITWALGAYGLGSTGIGIQTFGTNAVPRLESKFTKEAKDAGVSTALPHVVQLDLPWYRKLSDGGGLDSHSSWKDRALVAAKIADEKKGGGSVILDRVKSLPAKEFASHEAYKQIVAFLYPSIIEYQRELAKILRDKKAAQ